MKEASKWLEQATSNNLIDHVRLLASRGAWKRALDDALGIALTNNARSIAEELIRYGANPNTQHPFFRYAVERDEIELVTLFLQAPATSALTLVHLNSALSLSIKNGSSTTSLLLAHGAEPSWESEEVQSILIESCTLQMIGLLLLSRSKGVNPDYFFENGRSR